LQRDSGPGLHIELKPFLLGALFRDIGTPLVPMEGMPEAKRMYARKDMDDWDRYWGAINAQVRLLTFLLFNLMTYNA
jgi:2-hydroxychromene-2-carboxylate isomerase